MNFFTKYPKLKKNFFVLGGGGGGRVRDFFYKESRSIRNKKCYSM